MKKVFLSILTAAGIVLSGFSGPVLAEIQDRVIAVVGNEVILKSEVDERELMTRMQFPESKSDPQLRKHLVENMINQKILLTKAKIDSVKVDETAIDDQAGERFNSLRARFSSIGDMEAQFGRPVGRLKQDIRDDIRNQQLTDTLRRKHVKDVTVTYDEVMDYYRREKGHLPDVSEGVSVSQIIKYPVVSEAAKTEALEKIKMVQQKLKAGEDFATVARQYSDDPGSGALGGDLGFVQKGELVTSFEETAFALKPGQVSAIVETRFGYHIIQLLDKEGTSIHVRHILAIFDQSKTDVAKTMALLRTIRADIISGKTIFADMAMKYSDDPMSAKLGGLIKAANTGSSVFEPSSLKPELQKVIAGLKKAGEVSEPEQMTPASNASFFALFQLNSRVEGHRLTPERDFAKLEELAVAEKRQRLFNVWIDALKKEVLIREMPGSDI